MNWGRVEIGGSEFSVEVAARTEVWREGKGLCGENPHRPVRETPVKRDGVNLEKTLKCYLVEPVPTREVIGEPEGFGAEEASNCHYVSGKRGSRGSQS